MMCGGKIGIVKCHPVTGKDKFLFSVAAHHMVLLFLKRRKKYDFMW
jgi:hypothetical protein